MKEKGSLFNSFMAKVESNIIDKSLLVNFEFIFSIFSFIISLIFNIGSFNLSLNSFAILFALFDKEINLFKVSKNFV